MRSKEKLVKVDPAILAEDAAHEDGPFREDTQEDTEMAAKAEQKETKVTAGNAELEFIKLAGQLSIPMTGALNYKGKEFPYHTLTDVLNGVNEHMPGWHVVRNSWEDVTQFGDDVYVIITKAHYWLHEDAPDVHVRASESKMAVPVDKFNDQKAAGHLTYYWRRMLTTDLNLVQPDIDGNDGLDSKPEPKAKAAGLEEEAPMPKGKWGNSKRTGTKWAGDND